VRSQALLRLSSILDQLVPASPNGLGAATAGGARPEVRAGRRAKLPNIGDSP